MISARSVADAVLPRTVILSPFRVSGVAETVDWGEALVQLGTAVLDAPTVDATLGLLLKYHDDIERVRGALAAQLLAEAS